MSVSSQASIVYRGERIERDGAPARRAGRRARGSGRRSKEGARARGEDPHPRVAPDLLRTPGREAELTRCSAALAGLGCARRAPMAWYHKVPAPKLPAQDKRARLEGR